MKGNSILLISALFLSSWSAAADKNPHQSGSMPGPMTKQTRIEIIRLLNAEYAWVRKPFPMGEKGLVLKSNGDLSPSGVDLQRLIATNGLSAKPGDRVQITNLTFKSNGILFEINGGPKRKKKWYQHIQVGIGGASTPDNSGPQNPADIPKGSYLFLEFNHYLPEVTLPEIKALLAPVFDFSVKSAAEAYEETLPLNVRNAIRDHKALVGMNQEMVVDALGRPPQRIRDKDANNQDYEEWIFGTPPADVQFVRFAGDVVTRVEIMSVDGTKVVRTKPEVTLVDPALATAQPAPQAAPKKPAKAPTLRRPGEAAPDTGDGPPPPGGADDNQLFQ